MNKISLLRLFLLFFIAFSANHAFAQGLPDEDDEWETETLDALQPIWIQSRAKPTPTKTPTTIAPTVAVHRPRVAVSGAQLPTTPLPVVTQTQTKAQTDAKIAVKAAEATVIAESTATPKNMAAVAVSKETPKETPKEILKATPIVAANVVLIATPSEIPIIAAKVVEVVASKPMSIDVKSRPFPIDKTIANQAVLPTTSPIIALPLEKKETIIAIPENTMPNGTVLASVNLTPLQYVVKAEPMPSPIPTISVPIIANPVIAKATSPVASIPIPQIAAKPTELKIAKFTPLPATKPSLAIELSKEELPAAKIAIVKTAEKPKIDLPLDEKIEVTDAKINVPNDAPPVKSGIAAVKLAPKATVAAEKVTTADLEGENRQAYAQAYEEFRVSNYAQAEPFLKDVIAAEPRFADGYRMLVECSEKQGNYKKAISYYHKYLEFYPNNEKDWFNLSLLYSKTKDMDRAVEACLRATTINPDYEKGKRRLVNLYAATGRIDDLAMQTTDEGIFKYGLVLYKQKKLTEAIERVNMMVTPTADAHYLKGVCYRKLNEDDKAIAAYNQAIALRSTHVDAITELGVLYYNQKNYAQAAEFFGKAFTLKTTDTELAFLYGRALVFNKEPKRAISYLEKAVAANPKNAEIKRFLTYAYYESDKPRDSEDEKSKAQAAVPAGLAQNATKARNQFYNEGLKAMETGEFYPAIQKFERAAKEDSREPRILYSMGLAYFNLKNYAKAIENFNKTIKIDLAYTKAYEALAKTYYAQGDADKAAENYELAIKNGSATLSNYSELAEVYAFSNQGERAAIYFEKAIHIAPNNAELRFNYGTTYLNANQFNKAIEQLQKATENAPQYWAAYYNIGQAYLKQEKLDEAMEVGEKLIKQNPQYANGYALCAIVCNKRGDSYNQDKYAKMAKKLDPSLPFD